MAVTTAAIEHALRSPRPQTRYIVGTMGGRPAALYAWAAWLLPQGLLDALVVGAVTRHAAA